LSWLSKWRKKEVALLAKKTPLQEPEVALLSDAGCHRPSNQDSGKIVHATNGTAKTSGLLVVVADGMGGHMAGEVASQTAVNTVAVVYQRAQGTPGEALDEAFREAHKSIRKLAAENQAMMGMGTTCTALAIVGNEAWAAHVGDSRLYLVRGDDIYQLTEDHTAIMELVRQGLLTFEEGEHHEERNLLVRAMGTKPELSIMRWPEPMDVRPKDAFLVCSDGLHNLVNDSEMMAVVKAAPPKEACRKLIQMAKQRGGYDNITVAVVAIPPISGQPEALKETWPVEVAQ
jgi:serine/threonine protein phosphatase PrpC